LLGRREVRDRGNYLPPSASPRCPPLARSVRVWPSMPPWQTQQPTGRPRTPRCPATRPRCPVCSSGTFQPGDELLFEEPGVDPPRLPFGRLEDLGEEAARRGHAADMEPVVGRTHRSRGLCPVAI